ncbi:hypothetical protein AAF712_015163 [Marasmius tenuissimus]|uniref:Uncharacterized protein n=1 Tax=Marasmius tenuissimus TaxID=585030 RepID=A0ABR2ZBA5_9AGAR
MNIDGDQQAAMSTSTPSSGQPDAMAINLNNSEFAPAKPTAPKKKTNGGKPKPCTFTKAISLPNLNYARRHFCELQNSLGKPAYENNFDDWFKSTDAAVAIQGISAKRRSAQAAQRKAAATTTS